VRSSLRRVGSDADYTPAAEYETRRAKASRVALRQLICDTTKVNTGAAETTRTDTHISRLRVEITQLEAEITSSLTPTPLRERLKQRITFLRDTADRHQRTRLAGPRAPQEPAEYE
jgi:hypothetical protein